MDTNSNAITAGYEKGEFSGEHLGTATYSLEDNKLRFYPFHRLDKEDYERIRTAGFIWAPKQELFVAPAWSPSREDLMLEWCGDIDDEDTSLAERAEARAERFQDYSADAGQRAESAREQVDYIANGRPLGQPILIGHHSMRKAMRDQEKIEAGIRRAINEFDKADYWKKRARGSLRHASRRERPDVIYRRIKKLEADLRKAEKSLKEAAALKPEVQAVGYKAYPWHYTNSDEDKALFETASLEKLAEVARVRIANTIRHYTRWITHYNNRLAYERELYEGSGGIPADNGNVLEVGGAIYAWGGWKEIIKVNKVTVTVPSGYGYNHKIRLDDIKQIKSKIEYEAFKRGEFTEADVELVKARPAWTPPEPGPTDDLEAALESLKDTRPVYVPDYYPTPAWLVDDMIEKAALTAWSLVILEPSAGEGAIADRLVTYKHHLVEVCEINPTARKILEDKGHWIVGEDFMEYAPDPEYTEGYDRVIMNPPFSNDQDLDHVRHAFDLLREGGRLVAIMPCSSLTNRHTNKAKAFVEWFEGALAAVYDLPEDTFKAAGANIRTKLIVIDK